MRLILIFILFNINCFLYSANKSFFDGKKVISFCMLGQSGYMGLSYEYFLKENSSVDLAFGFLGTGIGLNYYSSNNNFFYSIKSGYLLQGSGGARIINNFPVGLYKNVKKMKLSIEIGPSYIIQITPNGSYPLNYNFSDSKHKFLFWGSFKIGYEI